MTVEKYCAACGMSFDWTGVTDENIDYCCEACCQGEPCTCPQHAHHDHLTGRGERFAGRRSAPPLRRRSPRAL